MNGGGAMRTLLLSGAAMCIATATALSWQHATRPGVDFSPAADDICIVPPSRASTAFPWNPASGLGKYDARPAPADARCPVCGMYPARFPTWVAQIIFKDGSAHFFDSPVDLLIFLQDPGRFDAEHSASDIAKRYVVDHRSGDWLDAGKASFVLGSSARGPMRGPDLPAFDSTAEATAFVAASGGRIVTLGDIDADVLAGLRDASHASHTR
jgi:nitrous oxide reductase accessory protein NosL